MSSVMHAQADRALRALVIDDDPIVRRFISSVLGASGFEVLEATDAKQALVAFYAVGSAVDLVITDIRMPGIDGCELARMLLATDRTLPILLVSGSHSESAASFPFLQKPFTSALLLHALREMLAPQRVLPGRQLCR